MDELVSIIVVTYNSLEFVFETLESIEKQTYNNIELIITDDCSTDNTILKVKEWITKHKNRFRNVHVVESKKNTGISANCNRGLLKAQGQYIKFIAGDDLLLENCITDNMQFAKENNSSVVFSKIRILSKLPENNLYITAVLRYQEDSIKFLTWNTHKQFKKLIIRNYLLAPSVFLNRNYLMNMGGYDERFFIEDYPLWLKSLQIGMKFDFLDKDTVLYRIHKRQSTVNEEGIYKKIFLDDEYRIYRNLRRKHLSLLRRWHEYINFFVAYKVIYSGNTQQEYRKWSMIMLLSPLFYLFFCKDKISKYFHRLRDYLN